MAEPFKSELDWSPESWFGKRVNKPDGTKYTPEDEKSLKSHIQEYLDIERDSKVNRTWLKMPDESQWTGDPRSWVMMQSKAFKENYSSQPWWTGQFGDDVVKSSYYNGTMWFSDNVGDGYTRDYYIPNEDLQNAIQHSKDNGYFIEQLFDLKYDKGVNEFISQPGFTDKVKFIDGNNGDFDITNPHKYSYNQTKNILKAFYGIKLNKKRLV